MTPYLIRDPEEPDRLRFEGEDWGGATVGIFLLPLLPGV
jgi:hypothetical protein